MPKMSKKANRKSTAA